MAAATAIFANAAWGSLYAADAAAGGILLAPGDTVELGVISLPDIHLQAIIGPDETFGLPSGQELKTSGLTIAQLRERVRQQLEGVIVTRRDSNGMEVPIRLSGREISLEVKEYRPVYVTGDVKTSGQQPFRPGLTVRQAIANAGGYSLLHGDFGNPVIRLLELQGQIDKLELERAQLSARADRIAASLAEDDPAQPANASASAPLAENPFASIEAEIGRTEDAGAASELSYFQNYETGLSAQIERVGQQQDAEAEAVALDTEDFERLGELSKSGTVTASRLSDGRRALLSSSTRLLQTKVELGNLNTQQMTATRDAAAFQSKRRLDLLNQASLVRLQIATADRDIAALRDQAALVRGAQGELGGALADHAAIRRFPSAPGLAAGDISPDSPLNPGDTIEIRLPDITAQSSGTGQ